MIPNPFAVRRPLLVAALGALVLGPVIAGAEPTIGEILPTYGRNLNMRLTVRDIGPTIGVFGTDTALLTVDPVAGPFLVTAPNTAIVWSGAGPHSVTWDVGGTDVAPVSCASVDVLLSTNGGVLFDNALAGFLELDGGRTVTFAVLANHHPLAGRLVAAQIDTLVVDLARRYGESWERPLTRSAAGRHLLGSTRREDVAEATRQDTCPILPVLRDRRIAVESP